MPSGHVYQLQYCLLFEDWRDVCAALYGFHPKLVQMFVLYVEHLQ